MHDQAEEDALVVLRGHQRGIPSFKTPVILPGEREGRDGVDPDKGKYLLSYLPNFSLSIFLVCVRSP